MTRDRSPLPPDRQPLTARPIRRRHGAARTVAVVIGALVVGALLNADALLSTASSQEAGPRRDVAIAVATPLVEVSHAIGLDRPRAWLESVLGRTTDDPASLPDPAPEPEPTEAPSPPFATPSPSPDPSPVPDPIPSPRVTPTPPALLATITDPAALWVAGDSLTETFGPALVNLALESRVLEPDHDLTYSSGLTRPDFFDWPAFLERRLAEQPADIVVFMIGANDAQPIQIGGAWVEYGSAAWFDEYERRVEHTAEVLAAGARTVYWIGQPIARPSAYSDRMAQLDAIYERVVADHPSVRYVSSWELFSTPDGSYSAYLPGADGAQVLVRAGDGIHLTRDGGAWLADHVLSAISQDWRLEAPG